MSKANKVEIQPIVSKKAVNVELSNDQVEMLNGLQTTSARIRYLDSIGLERADIARKLNKRYQHVRNVLLQPIKNK